MPRYFKALGRIPNFDRQIENLCQHVVDPGEQHRSARDVNFLHFLIVLVFVVVEREPDFAADVFEHREHGVLHGFKRAAGIALHFFHVLGIFAEALGDGFGQVVTSHENLALKIRRIPAHDVDVRFARADIDQRAHFGIVDAQAGVAQFKRIAQSQKIDIHNLWAQAHRLQQVHVLFDQIFLGRNQQHFHLRRAARRNAGARSGRLCVFGGHRQVPQALRVKLHFGDIEGYVLVRFVLHGLLQFAVRNHHHRNLPVNHRAARNGRDAALGFDAAFAQGFLNRVARRFRRFDLRAAHARNNQALAHAGHLHRFDG